MLDLPISILNAWNVASYGHYAAMLFHLQIPTNYLHLTHGHHFLSEIVLVLADAAIPSFDRLVLAHHDVLGNLVEQSRRSVSISVCFG
jgi:hypothetical protein